MRTLLLFLCYLTVVFLIPIVVAAEDQPAISPDNLYSVNSKDANWPDVDLVITEIERGDRISLFHIPNYTERTAMESRFAMCAFSQAAILRGFSHWLSSYSTPDKDHVRVGFYSGAIESPNALFDVSFLPSEGKKNPGASLYAGMCQFFSPFSGETINKSSDTDANQDGAG